MFSVMRKLPSKKDLFSKDERAHDGHNDHHKRAKSSHKDGSSFLHDQSLDIVCNAWRNYTLYMKKPTIIQIFLIELRETGERDQEREGLTA